MVDSANVHLLLVHSKRTQLPSDSKERKKERKKTFFGFFSPVKKCESEVQGESEKTDFVKFSRFSVSRDSVCQSTLLLYNWHFVRRTQVCLVQDCSITFLFVCLLAHTISTHQWPIL